MSFAAIKNCYAKKNKDKKNGMKVIQGPSCIFTFEQSNHPRQFHLIPNLEALEKTGYIKRTNDINREY